MERDPEISRLYRQALDAEPPERLDRLILDAAKKQLAVTPVRQRSAWQRWFMPAAGVFATLVLGVFLAQLVDREQRQINDPYRVPLQKAAPLDALPSLPQTAGEAAHSAAIPVGKPALARRADEAPHRAVAKVPSSGTMLPPTIDSAKSLDSMRQETVVSDRIILQRKPLPLSPLSAPAAATEPETAGKLESAPAGIRAPAAFPAQKSAPYSPPADAGTATGNARLKSQSLSEETTATPARERGNLSLGHSLRLPAPEIWLDRIRRLKQQGRLDEASVSLAEFRRTYPDYTLPEDLK